MKKRILSLILALMICFAMIPVQETSAAEISKALNNYVVFGISNWAINDLVTGESYGIYPLKWEDSDMTIPISEGKLWMLLAGLRIKILNTDCVTENPDVAYKTSSKMTVKDVLKVYNSLLTTMKYSKDLGINKNTPIDNMKRIGVYLGTNGEPALTDPCSIEAACVYATRIITYVYNQFDTASKGFFWVTKSGGNTVYMLGSLHLATTDIYPLDDQILKAYHSADALVEELNMRDAEGALKMVLLGMYSDGTTLKDHVSKEMYKKIVTFAVKYGYPESRVALFKPWLLYTLFASLSFTNSGSTADAASSAGLGIDMNFLVNATLEGKKVMEVEGYLKQGQVLDSFSEKLQIYLLDQTIDSITNTIIGKENTNAEYLDDMLKLWHDGDIETFLKDSTDDETDTDLSTSTDKELAKEFITKLFKQRDEEMADYIANLLKGEGSHTYFVIVGSGHYVSDYSVLDRLKDKGYQIDQIK